MDLKKIFLKLRLAIVEAVGHMTHVMDRDKLGEQLPKILNGIMALYKRHPEAYHITQVSLSNIYSCGSLGELGLGCANL